MTLAKIKAALWTSLAAGYSRRSGDALEDCTEHDLHGIHGMRGHHGGRWQAWCSAALHCMASPWRRELRTIGRCPSQWFGFAPRHCAPTHATLSSISQAGLGAACVSTQSASARRRVLAPADICFRQSLQVLGRCSAGGAATAGASERWPFHGGGDLEKRGSRRQRVEVLDHKRHHPIVAPIPPTTPTECNAKLKARRESPAGPKKKPGGDPRRVPPNAPPLFR